MLVELVSEASSRFVVSFQIPDRGREVWAIEHFSCALFICTPTQSDWGGNFVDVTGAFEVAMSVIERLLQNSACRNHSSLL